MQSDEKLQSLDYENFSEKDNFDNNYFFVINIFILFSLTILLPYIFVKLFHQIKLLNFVVIQESEKYFPFLSLDFLKNHFFIYNFTDLSNTKELEISLSAERQDSIGTLKVFSQFTLSKIPANEIETIIFNKSTFFSFNNGQKFSNKLHFKIRFNPNEQAYMVFLNFTCTSTDIAGFHCQNAFISNQSDGSNKINSLIRKMSLYFVIL